MEIALESPAAITVARVGFGGFPLGFGLVLLGCAVSPKHLPTGLALLLTVVSAVTLVRIQGLVIDGPTTHNLRLLRPEFAMIVLSAVGIVLQRRLTAAPVSRA
jgi:hypothetical protein